MFAQQVSSHKLGKYIHKNIYYICIFYHIICEKLIISNFYHKKLCVYQNRQK